jgi:transcriptional regulator with XRE-family HTH domain/Zn-dependent peptidase ImmA (M78 family)
MLKKKNVLRFILGLKIRQLRIRNKLSLKELADDSGLSISYLNEIEKGKKYPKIEKLASLAAALEVDLGEMVSFKTGHNLHPLLDFLEGDLISRMPLDLFGLNEEDVVSLMGNDPLKFASFVLTVLQISRSFDIRMEDVNKAALLSLIEANDNYFPELEKMARKARSTLGLTLAPVTYNKISSLITSHYGIDVDTKELSLNSLLQDKEMVVKRSAPPKIYLNEKLEEGQKSFCLAKEIAHLLLTKERPESSLGGLLEDYKEKYLAGAILLDENKFSKKLKFFLTSKLLDTTLLLKYMNNYKISAELLFQRLTQILPSSFKIHELFFLKMTTGHETAKDYSIDQELHLYQLHSPHGQRMNESYCRRWVAIKSLSSLKMSNLTNYISSQISITEEKKEYFSISYAKKSNLNFNKLESFTIGFLINDQLSKLIHFLNDPSLIRVRIGQTCERCPIQNCLERATPPFIHLKNILEENKKTALQELLK